MSGTMRAQVVRAFNGPLVEEERPIPQPRHADEVLVRVTAAGVCHSDLHVVDGHWPGLPLPRVLGHEIAGELDGVPVLVYAPWGCGTCKHCERTDEQVCRDVAEAGILQDGGYAEWVRVPSRRFVYPLAGLDPVRAAPLACGGLTPFRAVRSVAHKLGRGSTAVVLGAGGLGQFAIQYLRLLTDARVLVGDPAADKQLRARELGAEVAVAPDELEGPVDVVLDFVGAEQTLALGARLVDRGGTLLVLGLWGGTVPFGLAAVPQEAEFRSSIWGSRDELAALIALAGKGELQFEVETMPLAAAEQAHQRLRAGDVRGRIVLVPENA